MSFQVRAPGHQATHAYQLDSRLQSLGKEQFINEKPPFQNFTETKGQIRLIDWQILTQELEKQRKAPETPEKHLQKGS